MTLVGQTDRNRNYGKGLIGAWTLVYLGMAVRDQIVVMIKHLIFEAKPRSADIYYQASNSIYQYQNLRFITRLRGGLTALVYQRIVQTRAVDQGEITGVSLMGTDIQRIASSLRLLHEVWASLLDIAIACWLLEQQLYLACIAPIILVIGKSTKMSLLLVGAH